MTVDVTGSVGFDGRRWRWRAQAQFRGAGHDWPSWVAIDVEGFTEGGTARTEARAERRCRKAMRRLQRAGERRDGPATVRAVFTEDDDL